MKYDFVFVVLVYRNTGDLIDFFEHLDLPNVKVIIVNSYFDDESEAKFKKIADENRADFISVPNKGYGAGNNRGIEYALKNYDFLYLVVSNADVIIKHMKIEDLTGYCNYICAPNIIDIRGKRQNPHAAFRKTKLHYSIRYHLQKYNLPGMMLFYSIISRFNKIIFYSLNKFFGRNLIYAAHGAFVIFPYNIINKMVPLYNEDMFLFGEESHLGLKAERLGISTIYVPKIVIEHKEDGSVSLEKINTSKIGKESFNRLYEYWFKS